jgi:hypothetical protein
LLQHKYGSDSGIHVTGLVGLSTEASAVQEQLCNFGQINTIAQQTGAAWTMVCLELKASLVSV